MKTEEFFEMLGELDEKMVAKASEDLENYRYSLSRSYRIEEKDKFSWKRMSIAAVCAAAVMVGVFFSVKFFTNRDIPYYPGGSSITSDDVSSDNSGGNSSDTSNTSSDTSNTSSETSSTSSETSSTSSETSSTSSDTSSTSSDTSSTSSDTSSTTPEPVVPEKKPAYDAVYKGVNNPGVYGPPLTYEEIVNMLKPNPDHPEYDTDSLYLVEVIRALSPEECEKLAGWDSEHSFNTIYSVRVLINLDSGETINKTANVVASSGTLEIQTIGDPPYAPGERFTAALTKPYEGKDFVWVDGLFQYDIVEENGKTMLYSRGSDIDEQNLPTSENINQSVITSTTQNPAEYTQKLELSALVDFWRKVQKDLNDNSASEFDPNSPYPYQEAIKSGRISPDAPKLDLATAKKIIAEIGYYYEIIAEFEKIQPYPDYSKYTGTQYTKYCPTQYEVISTVSDEGQIDYVQYNPDGTIKYSEVLFQEDYGYGFDPKGKFSFLFYTSISGSHEFKRGDEFTATVDIVNHTGKPYVFEGSSSQYRPEVKLYNSDNGEEYVIPYEPIPDTDDYGSHEIAPGELRTITYFFKIPEDAPIGTYEWLVSYENSEYNSHGGIFVVG